ncbi:hypothetical protein BASA50_002961 [Batrachochytrium salamandrivorans]|uniref:MORN repeat-containing protein 5 n=1 Tax=Batrachochytrium salamandrivorans TaxID=1357716 RepID=A0ABQ8FK94_9FUNG|nr:hypothetical protein BASA60_006723 [Batrachochytrium salamandrivorans]KAH6575532.1 hypothetical protein BASA62_001871 [Batrachochytrium salamandrivorans]KAH6599619.1 hypothetical protein BASA50_002961 [Batrachochytrium salamandrivorans]
MMVLQLVSLLPTYNTIGKLDTTSTLCKSGTYMFKDGSLYEGEYKEIDGGCIVRSGTGKYTCGTSKSIYTGQWDHDKMDGKGKLEFASGAYYDGSWKDNQYMGEGTYRWSDGTMFSGAWLENGMNGPGKYTDMDGQGWIGSIFKGKMATLAPDLHPSPSC